MGFRKNDLRRIFDHSSGKCHICHGWLVFDNYGSMGADGAWEVEHSKPKARGGTDHCNNLYPAHIECNRAKGKKAAQTARRAHGKKRPPLNREQRAKHQEDQAVKGLGLGALLAPLIDPTGLGLLAGMILGAAAGRKRDPDD